MEQKGNKLKIVWLCGFSNSHIQKRIKVWRKGGEISIWITNLLKLFENSNDIELHVISFHTWMFGYKSFRENGITYHFFNQGIPLIGMNWPEWFPFDFWTDYWWNKIRVKRLVNKIKPDLIHLHGAENTYHTPAIIQFENKYPIFVTVQGFVYKSSEITKKIKRKIEREKYILSNFQYFAYRIESMKRDILNFNPNAVFLYHNYVMKIDIKGFDLNVPKEYDIVFFARVTKDKGIEDLIQALAIIKKNNSNISLLVIGLTSKDYLNYLKKLAVSLNVLLNITWRGYVKERNDLYKEVLKAKTCVLPTYHDMIPGTILESLLLKIPVIAYNVGSIYEINTYENIVELVEKFDIKALANRIVALLGNENLRNEKGEKGSKRIKVMFDNSRIYNDILSAYHKIVNDVN